MVQVIRKSNQSLWDRIRNIGRQLDGVELKAGWFETSRYEDGTPVAYVATIHEFGHPESGIPPRPFMRPAIADGEGLWRAFAVQEAAKIFAGATTVEDMFEKLGLSVSGDIAKAITAVTEPALKPATIAAKRRKMANQSVVGALDKPLVESGLMLASVTHTVETP